MPKERVWELDGIPFIGKTDIADLTSEVNDGKITLKWASDASNNRATIYMATTNNFANGGSDKWEKVGSTSARNEQFTIDLAKYPASKFYKFAVVTKNNHLTRWYIPK